MSNRPLTAALAALVAAGSLGLAAVPAQAAPTATVHYGDLDLASAVGQRTLARRLSGAADQVCPQDMGDRFAQLDCRRAALTRARTDLHKAGVPTL